MRRCILLACLLLLPVALSGCLQADPQTRATGGLNVPEARMKIAEIRTHQLGACVSGEAGARGVSEHIMACAEIGMPGTLMDDPAQHMLLTRIQGALGVHDDADPGYWLVAVMKDDREWFRFTPRHHTPTVRACNLDLGCGYDGLDVTPLPDGK